jgi:hypothetical protein
MFQGIVSGGISGVLCGQIKVGQGYPKNPRLREDCEGKADQQGAFEQICSSAHIRAYALSRNMRSVAELKPKKPASSAPNTAHI